MSRLSVACHFPVSSSSDCLYDLARVSPAARVRLFQLMKEQTCFLKTFLRSYRHHCQNGENKTFFPNKKPTIFFSKYKNGNSLLQSEIINLLLFFFQGKQNACRHLHAFKLFVVVVCLYEKFGGKTIFKLTRVNCGMDSPKQQTHRIDLSRLWRMGENEGEKK